MNRLRVPVAPRPRKLKGALGLGSGPEGRIEKLRQIVTELFRHERIEGSYGKLDEARGYAELLIQQACRNGAKDSKTLEMADFWLLEKDLVQKLFKVLVPRYESSTVSYTAQYQLPSKYPANRPQVVLELRGNPWPAVLQNQVDNSKWINNVLIESASKNLDKQKVQKAIEQDTTSHSETPV